MESANSSLGPALPGAVIFTGSRQRPVADGV